MQYAIKETKEMLDLAIGGVNAGFAIGADGKVDFADLGHVMALVPLAGPAFENKEQIPLEMGDLDTAEAAELIAHVGAKLAVTDAKAKVYIEYGLKIIHKAYLIYLDAKEMKEKAAVA